MIRHYRVTYPHAKRLHNQSERALYDHNFINIYRHQTLDTVGNIFLVWGFPNKDNYM